MRCQVTIYVTKNYYSEKKVMYNVIMTNNFNHFAILLEVYFYSFNECFCTASAILKDFAYDTD